MLENGRSSFDRDADGTIDFDRHHLEAQEIFLTSLHRVHYIHSELRARLRFSPGSAGDAKSATAMSAPIVFLNMTLPLSWRRP